ncbi:phage tail tip lysozyme [Rhizobium laguerreae]|uniref:phage tail tip lysozyme n=1 Tax=Rhizobium laguerreae TaxID=1076926 RepID=UPI001389A103|nr:phage tail tip lysozyme [Rhizobium laguerreae]NDK54039.1 lytic murein transglycosylase [Rhizobium laguerreae]
MGFIFGGDTGQSQADVTDARKRLAAAMLQQGTDTSPIQSPWEGAARMAQALMGGLAIKNQANQQQAADAQVIAAITGQPYTPPEKPAGFLSSIFGGNKPATPGATGSSMPQTDSSGNVALPSTGKEWETIGPRLVGDLSKDFRLTPEQAVGVVGPLGQESVGFGKLQEVNPVVPGSRGGYGYAQWTGPRRKAFEAWSQQNGFDPSSYEANYGFLKHELMNTPEGAVLDDLRKAPDAMTAGRVFTDKFLRPGVPNYDSRDAWTKRAMAFANSPTQVAGADPAMGMPPASPIQPPPVNPPAPPPQPGYVDPMIAPRASAPPMPRAVAPGEVASLDPSIGIPMPGAAGQMRASAPAQPMPPQGAPRAELPPLPTSTVGPTPNVASVQPAGMPSSQIPPEFQNSPQLMNADPNKGIMPALLGGSPASPEQVAQAQQSGQARLTQALVGATPPPSANTMADPRAQALVNAINNPNASPQVKAMAAQSLQTLMRPPEYGFETMQDGTIVRTDPRSGTVQPIYQSTPKPTEVNGRLVGADGKVIADFSNGQWERMSDGTLYNKSTGEFRQAPEGASGEKFYGSTVPYYDKDGNLRYRQLSDRGGGKDLDLGPGATAAPTTRTVDTGTELITLGPGGQEVKRTTKQNYEAAKDTAQGSTEGKAAGEAVSSLPADLMQADQTIKNIDELLTSKGLDSIVGSVDQFRPSWTTGADGRDALTRLKQLQGGAFLQAYGLLKGGGQITEVEGGKAQDAMARMDRSLDEPHFRAALKDFRDAVEQGVAKMKERAKVAAPSAPADPTVVPTDVPGVTIRRKN